MTTARNWSGKSDFLNRGSPLDATMSDDGDDGRNDDDDDDGTDDGDDDDDDDGSTQETIRDCARLHETPNQPGY